MGGGFSISTNGKFIHGMGHDCDITICKSGWFTTIQEPMMVYVYPVGSRSQICTFKLRKGYTGDTYKCTIPSDLFTVGVSYVAKLWTNDGMFATMLAESPPIRVVGFDPAGYDHKSAAMKAMDALRKEQLREDRAALKRLRDAKARERLEARHAAAARKYAAAQRAAAKKAAEAAYRRKAAQQLALARAEAAQHSRTMKVFLRKHFNAIDTDGNRNLEAKELARYIQKMDGNITAKQVRHRVEVVNVRLTLRCALRVLLARAAPAHYSHTRADVPHPPHPGAEDVR